MTDKPPHPKDGPDTHAPAVDAIPPGATGHWVAQTARTTHLFDLDQATYTRIPDVGRKAMPYDRQRLALREVVKAPEVGGQFFIYVDALDAAGDVAAELWRVSATITRVTKIEPAEADKLLKRP